MKNVTPRPFSVFGPIAGGVCVIVGAWLIYSDWETLVRFLKLFLGLFLLLFGLGVLGASWRR